MEAKDTVMSEEQLVELPSYERDSVLLAQAEISFKAGMKEVVEWIETYQRGGGYYQFETVDWQAFEEEKGL